MIKMKGMLVLCSLIVTSAGQHEASVTQAISNGIGDMVLECQKELEFKNDIIRDLLDFWNYDNGLRSKDLGCALVCVLAKNKFLNDDFKQIQRANVNKFFKASGADEKMSGTLLELLQLCLKSSSNIKNLCTSTLEMAKCFRQGIFQLNWMPYQKTLV